MKKMKFTGGSFVTAFRNSMQRGNKCPYHSHDYVEIVYHLKGSGSTSVPGGEYEPFAERSLVIYAAHVVHNQIMDEDGIDLCYLVDIKAGEWPFAKNTCMIGEVSHPYLLRELQDYDSWVSEERKLWKDVLDLRVSALFAGLAKEALLKRKSVELSPSSHSATAARRLVETKISEMRNVSDISERLGLSQDYTRHVFKTEYGMTLTNFILMTRVNRAMELLKFSTICQKEIAPLCGFANERQMSVTFKKLAGLSPGAYRNRGRGNNTEY